MKRSFGDRFVESVYYRRYYFIVASIALLADSIWRLLSGDMKEGIPLLVFTLLFGVLLAVCLLKQRKNSTQGE